MTNLSKIIYKMANVEYKSHPFSKEWSTGIVFTAILRLITMFVSGYAGYLFFYNLFLEHTGSIVFTVIVSVILLIIIEVLTNFTLGKFFKFALKKNPKAAIASFIGVAICFTISFIAATNGLALRTYQKADQSALIATNNEAEINNIRTSYNSQISEIGKQIQIVNQNPQGWIDGRRAVLTASQLATIKTYNQRVFDLQNKMQSQIESLQGDLKTKLEENRDNAQLQSDKFYKFSVTIMILQMLSAGALMFFWKKVYYEINEELARNEEIQDLRNEIHQSLWSSLIGETKNMMQTVFTGIETQKMIGPKPVLTAIKNQPKPVIKTIGFFSKNQSEKTASPSGYTNGHEKNQQEKTSEKNQLITSDKNQLVLIVQRHPDIVKEIVNKVDPGTVTISNQSCYEIENHTSKSRSLIRNVFFAIQGVGFGRIDKRTGKILEG